MLIIVRYLNLFQFWIQLFPGKQHSSSVKKTSYKNEQTPDTLMFTAGVLLDVIPKIIWDQSLDHPRNFGCVKQWFLVDCSFNQSTYAPSDCFFSFMSSICWLNIVNWLKWFLKPKEKKWWLMRPLFDAKAKTFFRCLILLINSGVLGVKHVVSLVKPRHVYLRTLSFNPSNEPPLFAG